MDTHTYQHDNMQRDENESTTSELYFLIADFLTRYSPCQKTARLLQEELETHKLLPQGVSVDGTVLTSSFSNVRRKFQTLPPDQLLSVFSNFKENLSKDKNFKGSLLNYRPSCSKGYNEVTKTFMENLFQLRDAESELKRLKIRRSTREPSLESALRIQNSINSEVNMKLTYKGFESWISESGHVRVHRILRVSSDIIIALTGSASNVVPKQKTSELKPGMFVSVSQYATDDDNDNNDDDSKRKNNIIALVVKANPSNALGIQGVRLRVRATSWQHMQSKIRHGMISSSTRINDLERRTLALRNRIAKPRFPLMISSNLSSSFLQRVSSSKRKERNDTTSLYKKITHMRTVSGHQSYPIFCILYDNINKRVITGADDYLVKVWSARTGQLLYTCRGHKDVIVDVVVDQQGKFMASASQDKIIRVWDLPSERGRPVAVLRGHTEMVNKLAFDFKCCVLISASDDGTCRVWNLRSVYEDPSRVHTNVPCQSVSIWQIDMPTRSSKVFWVSVNPIQAKFVCGGKDGILHVVEYENSSSAGLKASVSDRLSAGGNRGRGTCVGARGVRPMPSLSLSLSPLPTHIHTHTHTLKVRPRRA
jgi:hypothetical protein